VSERHRLGGRLGAEEQRAQVRAEGGLAVRKIAVDQETRGRLSFVGVAVAAPLTGAPAGPAGNL